MMPMGARRGTRLLAALLAISALAPALHHALSHHASGATAGSVEISADLDTHAPAPETCPVCLAGKSRTALPALASPQRSPAPEAFATLPEHQHTVSRIARGPASPRAPPSA